MTRIKATAIKLNDDDSYTAELDSAKIVKSNNPQYPNDQLEVIWRLEDGQKPLDRLSLKLGVTAATKQPSRLRQMLNALAERAKDEELWFDPDTLEWGYDLNGEDTTPAHAKLTIGMPVSFTGENRPDANGVKRYKITAYRKAKAAK